MNWKELEDQADKAAQEGRRGIYAGQTIKDLRRLLDEAERDGEIAIADELSFAFESKMQPHA